MSPLGPHRTELPMQKLANFIPKRPKFTTIIKLKNCYADERPETADGDVCDLLHILHILVDVKLLKFAYAYHLSK